MHLKPSMWVILGAVASTSAFVQPGDRAFGRDIASVYGRLLCKVDVPKTDWFYNRLPALKAPCGRDSSNEVSTSLRRGLYSGRSGSFLFAAQLALCRRDHSEEEGLMDLYTQFNRPDAQSSALVAYAGGKITKVEYESLAKSYLLKLGTQTNNVFSFFTGFISLQWAAGGCYDDLTEKCVRLSARQFMPAGWTLDPAANFSIGDLFGDRIEYMASSDALSILKDLIHTGVPVRRDISRYSCDNVRQRLDDVRHELFAQTFGPSESL